VGKSSHRACSRWVGDIAMRLAAATLTAVAGLIVVHRAVLTRLRTTWLVRRETDCANRGCQERKQDFEMITHERLSLAAFVKASEIASGLCLAGIAFREYG